MNKKVYELVLPIIIKKIEYNIIKNKKKEKIIEPIFDQLLLKNYENIPIMEYPKSSLKNNLKNNVILKNIEEERSTLIPKIKPIDFTNKENITKNNTVELYNNLLSSYNNDIIINNSPKINKKNNLDDLDSLNKFNKDSINIQSNNLDSLNEFNKDLSHIQSNNLHGLFTINKDLTHVKVKLIDFNVSRKFKSKSGNFNDELDN
jgi:hypothetical protein